jgi:hypothetical protein
VRFLGRESPGGVLTAHDDLQGRQDAHLLAPCAFGAPWQVVQETVAHLGELDGQGRARARLLALQITGDRSSTICSRRLRARASRWRRGWMRFAWNGRGALAMSGSTGGCGARRGSIASVLRGSHGVASSCRGPRWRRS